MALGAPSFLDVSSSWILVSSTTSSLALESVQKPAKTCISSTSISELSISSDDCTHGGTSSRDAFITEGMVYVPVARTEGTTFVTS